MSKQKQKISFSNTFSALALHEEQDPKEVLKKQSSRHQKKLEYQAQKALSSPGPFLNPQKPHQQHQQQQPASSSRHRTNSSSSSTAAANGTLKRQDSGPDSPGLKAALKAIGSSSSSTAANATLTRNDSGPMSPGLQAALKAIAEANAMHSLAATPDGIWPDSCYDAEAAHTSSEAGYTFSDADDSAWANALQDNSSDPWSTPSHLLQQQQQLLQLQQQQQQQQCQPAASPNLQVPTSPTPQCSRAAPSSAEAYGWRDFALRFAEAARQAGDEDAAVGALLFGASESLHTAAFAVDDSAAAVELAGVADQAAAAGLTIPELLQAQQQELLHQIDRAQQKGQIRRSNQRMGRSSTWQQVPAHLWAADAVSISASSGSSSRGTSPAPALRSQLPDVDDASAFPQLETSPNAGVWQQAGPSPYAVSKHWKGGRLAPKPKGVKVLNTPNSNSSSRPGQPGFRVTNLDLHWDLCMDGLAPMQRTGDGTSICSFDSSTSPGFGGGVGPRAVQQGVVGGLHGGEEAVQRTRQLLADQAAAAAAGGGQRADNGRDGLDPETLRSMMDGASRRARQPPGSSTPPPAAAAAASNDGLPSPTGGGGSKAAFGYSWGAIFKNACAAGWQPVSGRDGGGGSHFKLRRVLPISGTTQTMVLASTPSDTQRGVRNAAAAFKKKEEEMERLERAAVAEQQAAARSRGKHKQ